jgi:predicted ATPase
MRFYLGANELIFEDNAQYPAKATREKVQAIDRSAAGVLHVEIFTVPTITRRELVFEFMSRNDYLALLDWFENIAVGAKNSFFFEDEENITKEARIINSIYDFQQDAFHRYSGKMLLEFI